MRKYSMVAVVLSMATFAASPALAQRVAFERTFDVTEASVLDVSTIRGKIDISVGGPGRIIVRGDVTVRVDWDVPANAEQLARKVAEAPPIERDGNTFRLRPPSDSLERRALTVSYRVTVPRETQVLAVSDSGATTLRGVSGTVVIRTQSGAIQINDVGGSAGVTTGSGAVTVDGVSGPLVVTTSSSAFNGRSLRGGLRLRTSSGSVDAELSGPNDIDVETGSSTIRLRGVKGALTAVSQSGRVSIEGSPGKPWMTSTGSGSVTLEIGSGSAFGVDATSRSGSVKVVGAAVHGTTSKRKVVGTVGEGGPLVRVTTGSGSIGITVPAGPLSSREAGRLIFGER